MTDRRVRLQGALCCAPSGWEPQLGITQRISEHVNMNTGDLHALNSTTVLHHAAAAYAFCNGNYNGSSTAVVLYNVHADAFYCCNQSL